ncbi:MAG: hypothetical protein OWQ57_02290 [Sulfobacillus sp.]|nr:hypothetical protein [Sulfobacillus sp.]
MIPPVLQQIVTDDWNELAKAARRGDPIAWWNTLEHLWWVSEAIRLLRAVPLHDLVNLP